MSDCFTSFEFPKELVADWPVSVAGERSDAKLLVAKRQEAALELVDAQVKDIACYLKAGDLIVLNNTKVTPCRFRFKLVSGEQAEIFLIKPAVGADNSWECIGRALNKIPKGEIFQLSASLTASIVEYVSGQAIVNLRHTADGDILQAIQAEAMMPIPPYIRDGEAEALDKQLYQTVYAQVPGSLAAPTAGLHFTEQLLEELASKLIKHCFITLHVGRFSIQTPRNDVVETETFSIDQETWKYILQTKQAGGRIIAVGTTTVRALESNALEASQGYTETALFIKPGFDFKVVDAMFTNFHQPNSTHLLLVNAFLGAKNTESVYQHALKARYRLFSYGDAMLLL